MPRFDIHQAMFVNGIQLGRSVVRVSGDNAVNAAVNWMKSHGVPKATSKDVRILGNSTKFITARYQVSEDDLFTVELIPVESTKQCRDCGYPKEAPNTLCQGQCQEFRDEVVPIVMNLDEAEEALEEAF